MEILSNGSKWAGEPPDTIDHLLSALETCTLDPRFEELGNFVSRDSDGRFTAFGNFIDVSHGFRIHGTLEELRPLARAIRAHRLSPRYQKAFVRLFGSKQEHARRQRQLRRQLRKKPNRFA